eukprot:GHVL01036428.1.p1 GENE.GHVL01036428.1~~GHVL01036428.1.p1  ORF type:complete len:428 (+),score=88.27 GHVL01036428.1:98-1381(+)
MTRTNRDGQSRICSENESLSINTHVNPLGKTTKICTKKFFFGKNYFDSLEECFEIGGTLVEFVSLDMIDNFKSVSDKSSDCWIGLTREDPNANWQWAGAFGSAPDTTVTEWAEGVIPKEFELCAIYTDAGWTTQNCAMQKKCAICQVPVCYEPEVSCVGQVENPCTTASCFYPGAKCFPILCSETTEKCNEVSWWVDQGAGTWCPINNCHEDSPAVNSDMCVVWGNGDPDSTSPPPDSTSPPPDSTSPPPDSTSPPPDNNFPGESEETNDIQLPDFNATDDDDWTNEEYISYILQNTGPLMKCLPSGIKICWPQARIARRYFTWKDGALQDDLKCVSTKGRTFDDRAHAACLETTWEECETQVNLLGGDWMVATNIAGVPPGLVFWQLKDISIEATCRSTLRSPMLLSMLIWVVLEHLISIWSYVQI